MADPDITDTPPLMIKPDAPLRVRGDLYVRSARAESVISQSLIELGAQIVLKQEQRRGRTSNLSAVQGLAARRGRRRMRLVPRFLRRETPPVTLQI